MDARILVACLLACTVSALGEEAPAGPATVGSPAASPDSASRKSLVGGAKAVPDTTRGSLSITSEPSGAAVTFDGAAAGVTPVKVDSIAAGEHRLQISSVGYFTKSATVLVRSGAQEVQFTLTKPATLTVTAPVGNATVILNGEPIGKTPAIRAGLKPTTYDVRVQAAGRQDFVSQVRLAPGANDTIVAVFEQGPSSKAAAEREKPRRSRRIATIAAAVVFGLFTAAIIIVDVSSD